MEACGARRVAAALSPGAEGRGGGPKWLLAEQLAAALQGAGDPMAPFARRGASGPLRQPLGATGAAQGFWERSLWKELKT